SFFFFFSFSLKNNYAGKRCQINVYTSIFTYGNKASSEIPVFPPLSPLFLMISLLEALSSLFFTRF
ncbi:hypothetical protein, partial [Ligilactobacillus saerimneri]|uniref:hypothetical protein n=1 Tax=Ligilactobacillus saerimneri TaxID=228229 RepID=UPI00242C9D7B